MATAQWKLADLSTRTGLSKTRGEKIVRKNRWPIMDVPSKTARSKTRGKQIVRANRPRITGAPSKTVQPPRGPQMLRASILVWSRSNTEKWKRCASSRMWSARRSNSGTSRNSKNWNGRGRISSGRNSSSAASNSKWGKYAQQSQKLQERQQRDVQKQDKKQPKSERPPAR